MGYYTQYTLGVTGEQELVDELLELAESGEEFGDYDTPLMEWFEGDFNGGEGCKWYQWADDVKALSKRFPGLLFRIEGEGEESGDIWKAWTRNGKTIKVEARIVFDEPDLDKVLPSPDVEKAIESVREKKRAEIDAQIAKLIEAKKDLDQ